MLLSYDRCHIRLMSGKTRRNQKLQQLMHVLSGRISHSNVPVKHSHSHLASKGLNTSRAIERGNGYASQVVVSNYLHEQFLWQQQQQVHNKKKRLVTWSMRHCVGSWRLNELREWSLCEEWEKKKKKELQIYYRVKSWEHVNLGILKSKFDC